MPVRSFAANRCRKRRVAAEISAAGSLEFIESSLCRWTRLEGRPVDRLNEGLVWRKHFLERERKLRRAVRLKMRETLFGLVHARHVASRHPPQGEVGAGEFFEPGLPLPQHLGMRAVVHVALQLFHRFPDRQVEQDAVVIVGTKVGGVALGGLQTPDEAGAAVGERVDLLQPGDETGHHGTLERPFHPGDVDLGDVQIGHGLPRICRHFSLVYRSRRSSTIVCLLQACYEPWRYFAATCAARPLSRMMCSPVPARSALYECKSTRNCHP